MSEARSGADCDCLFFGRDRGEGLAARLLSLLLIGGEAATLSPAQPIRARHQ